MIAKISKGRALKTLARYLLHGSNNESPNRGEVLATNFAGSDIRSWSREFSAFRKLKPNLSRAITHISLNLSPEERELADDVFVEIAQRFKAGLGYTDDCPFLVVRHRDRDHQHIHLVLSRISLTGVIPETNDFRKAEKLAAALRAEFNLKGPADKKNNNEEVRMETNKKTKSRAEERAERLAAYATGRLEAVAQDAEVVTSNKVEPNAPSIEFFGETSVKNEREFRREALSDEYQRLMRELFEEQIRYVRKTNKALTLYFKDGARLYDTGGRVTAYDMPNPALAAQRLLDVVAMKGWDTGFVVRGSDDFIREVAIIAVKKNLHMVPLDAHQLAILNSVREQHGGSVSSLPAVAGISPLQGAPQTNPLSVLSGGKGLGQRLTERRGNEEPNTDHDGPENRRRPMGG